MANWRPVVGWEDRYEVSDQGEVAAVARLMIKGPIVGRWKRRLLSPYSSGRDKSYLRVKLYKEKRNRQRLVHILVLEAFAGSRPGPEYMACHKNDCSEDNRLVNLYWGTREDNDLDRYINGLDMSSMEPAPF